MASPKKKTTHKQTNRQINKQKQKHQRTHYDEHDKKAVVYWDSGCVIRLRNEGRSRRIPRGDGQRQVEGHLRDKQMFRKIYVIIPKEKRK